MVTFTSSVSKTPRQAKCGTTNPPPDLSPKAIRYCQQNPLMWILSGA
jgi:hypothetical protein